MTKKTSNGRLLVVMGVLSLIYFGMVVNLSDAEYWKQVLLDFWEPLPIIMVMVIPVTILIIWLMPKQSEEPLCPHCGQTLPEEKKHLDTQLENGNQQPERR